MEEISLLDDESLNINSECSHNFNYQANVKDIYGIIWDIYYCQKCLTHVKKERPCPMNIDSIDCKVATNL